MIKTTWLTFGKHFGLLEMHNFESWTSWHEKNTVFLFFSTNLKFSVFWWFHILPRDQAGNTLRYKLARLISEISVGVLTNLFAFFYSPFCCEHLSQNSAFRSPSLPFCYSPHIQAYSTNGAARDALVTTAENGPALQHNTATHKHKSPLHSALSVMWKLPISTVCTNITAKGP